MMDGGETGEKFGIGVAIFKKKRSYCLRSRKNQEGR
jgi:hypothetical protein